MVASALTEGIGLVMLVPLLGATTPNSGYPGRLTIAIAKLGIPLELGPLLVAFVVLVMVRSAII